MLEKNLVYRIDFLKTAEKQLKKIDRYWQSKILDYLDNDISPLEDPYVKGEALTGNKQGLWRYRVGKYRIVCDIQDDICLILVLEIGHRKQVYKTH